MTKISITKPVRLTGVQLATLDELKTQSGADGIIKSDVLETYKQNVVNALMNAGVIKSFRTKHAKLTGVEVTLLVRKPNIRTLRKAETETAAA